MRNNINFLIKNPLFYLSVLSSTACNTIGRNSVIEAHPLREKISADSGIENSSDSSLDCSEASASDTTRIIDPVAAHIRMHQESIKYIGKTIRDNWVSIQPNRRIYFLDSIGIDKERERMQEAIDKANLKIKAAATAGRDTTNACNAIYEAECQFSKINKNFEAAQFRPEYLEFRTKNVDNVVQMANKAADLVNGKPWCSWSFSCCCFSGSCSY